MEAISGSNTKPSPTPAGPMLPGSPPKCTAGALGPREFEIVPTPAVPVEGEEESAVAREVFPEGSDA